jgi:hypothetical protein
MNVLPLLIEERDRLNEAIAALEGGNVTAARRRGRPPKNANAQSPVTQVAQFIKTRMTQVVPSIKTRKPRSAASRANQAAKMKAYWAKRKKSSKK